jgi:release factor glutamine methyltransferase
MSELWTVGRLLEWTAPFFKQKGIESPRLDAEVLLAHVLKIQRLHLYTGYDRPLQQTELDAYRALVKRRATHEPVAYIVGTRGFHEIDLKVDKRVLVPRPETELVVERARKLEPKRFADIGTGSGAIALALLHVVPGATAVATDVSADALAVARMNAADLKFSERIDFREGAFFAPLRGERFPLIVSNPPYVEADAKLDADVVQFEPHVALFSGRDGLDAIRTLLATAASVLEPGGSLIFEFGRGQAEAICEIARSHGYTDSVIHRDADGLERVFEAVQR